VIISRSVKYSRIIKSGAADKILPRRPLIKYKILLAGGSDFNHMSNLLFEEFRLKTGTSPASKRSSFMRGFYGSGGRKAYFEGWYIKQQANDETIAFIPSFHVDEKGRCFAHLQAITSSGSAGMEYPIGEFSANQGNLDVTLGKNRFTEKGIEVSFSAEGMNIEGFLDFGEWHRPDTDIMGPFRFVPFMQCRHGVFSLFHDVRGVLEVNGKQIAFENGHGYIEADRGTSFPNSYIWTQCGWRDGGDPRCVMLSIAEIPFLAGRFTGCIGSVYCEGREYRLATYRRVKIERAGALGCEVRQGELRLTIDVLNKRPHELLAPNSGKMSRTIHESVSCRVRYRFRIGEVEKFDFISDCASFEHVEGIGV
jgi:hypothetical protein